MALAEPADSRAAAYLLDAAIVTAPPEAVSSGLFKQLWQELARKKDSSYISDRTEWANALAEKGNADDLPLLAPLLKPAQANESSTESDVRAAIAYAILKISGRMHHH